MTAVIFIQRSHIIRVFNLYMNTNDGIVEPPNLWTPPVSWHQTVVLAIYPLQHYIFNLP